MASPVRSSSASQTESADDQGRELEFAGTDSNIMSSLETQMDRVKVADFSEPPPQKLAFDQGFTYNVDSLLYTEHKKAMYYAFEVGGADGLAQYLYAYAKRQTAEKPQTSHRYFLEDEKQRDPILTFLITTMHPDVVKALICGNLSYRMFSDTHFKSTMDRTTQQSTSPGIYFNQFYDCGTTMDADTQETDSVRAKQTSNQGKGFSYDQWKVIKESILLYRNSSSESTAFAKLVDHVYLVPHGYKVVDHDENSELRRFLNVELEELGIARRHRRLDEFLRALDDHVINNLEEHAAATSEQAHWAPFEIGYGNDTLDRLKAHTGNQQTNWLWGLINGIVAVKFENQFKINQGQLLYICHHSHRNLGEALCSLLASSYHDQLGCNPQRAGGIGSNPYTSQRGYQTNTWLLFGLPDSPRARGYRRGVEHNQECLEALALRNKEEQEDAVAKAVERAEMRRKELLMRVEKASGVHETVRQDISKRNPLRHFQSG